MKGVVEMTDWKPHSLYPEGTLISVLGKKGDNSVEMHSIAIEKGFDIGFPLPVEKEAEQAKAKYHNGIPQTEIALRRDFRTTPTFTIDPVDAKDFDDAISFRETAPHTYEIGVHIADVSHFVTPGTALNKEAQERSFSVYLADRTIPMLPEILSNDLCSLNPDQDRLAFSAVFILKEEGKKITIQDRWFGKTIIRSIKRFSYETAQESISNGNDATSNTLRTLNRIAKTLQDERSRNGSIDFESNEIKITVDAEGRPISITRKARLDTHRLVEEYMLLANREVAHFMWKKTQQKNNANDPFLYRIHDYPNRERIISLAAFAKALGHDLPHKNGEVRVHDLKKLLTQIIGTSEESLIKTATIRSMAKAIYSTSNIGHFGLSFEYYTHFTSPIRRYPDLIVHRLLEKTLKGKNANATEMAVYQSIAEHASLREVSAAEAERDSKKLKQVEYMQRFIGKEFDGVISGITEWGMFIEEKETGSDGMIRLRDLGNDWFTFDEKTFSAVGEKSKKRFRLGDKIRFKVVGADPERKTLDYAIV
jgi:ribonuclease R